jgi:hypothetical protein
MKETRHDIGGIVHHHCLNFLFHNDKAFTGINKRMYCLEEQLYVKHDKIIVKAQVFSGFSFLEIKSSFEIR